MAELEAVFMEHTQTQEGEKVGHAIKVSVWPKGSDVDRRLERIFLGNDINDTLLQVSKGLTDMLRGDIPSAAAEQEQPKLMVLNAEEGKGE